MTGEYIQHLVSDPGRKVSSTFMVSEECVALYWDSFPRKGHVEYDEITEGDKAQWAMEEAALAVLENSRWVDFYEFDYAMRPLERKRWVPDETVEEYLIRYRAAKAAGWKRPDLFADIMQRAWGLVRGEE